MPGQIQGIQNHMKRHDVASESAYWVYTACGIRLSKKAANGTKYPWKPDAPYCAHCERIAKESE